MTRALAQVAAENRYARPRFPDSGEMRIDAGRHPVIEKLAEREARRFIPNDLYFRSPSANSSRVITGPNMGGKIDLSAAGRADGDPGADGLFRSGRCGALPLMDRVFTRIGAADNLARGRSTFMVEMTETAVILNTATARSLMVLDEIGRGTATYDGLALAWAVVEHIHQRIRAKTLFATHYHELTELAEQLGGRAQICSVGEGIGRPDLVPAKSGTRTRGPQLWHRSGAPGGASREGDRAGAGGFIAS